MKLFLLFIILSSLQNYTLAFFNMHDANLLADRKWQNFKSVNGKRYKNLAEERMRRTIWQENSEFIEKHNDNQNNSSYTLAMNSFGDLTNDEYRRLMTVCKPTHFHMTIKNRNKQINTNRNSLNNDNCTDIPNSIDWRNQGLVTKVKNQGPCGSCWSFSTTAALEGQWAKKRGVLNSLSEQNLIDCADEKYDNYACDGGWMDSAFQYIIDNNGIDSESSYPYEAMQGPCRYDPLNVAATAVGYVDIEPGNEKALTDAVACIGPISAAMDFSASELQFYSGGVYSNPKCSQTNLDHAVTVVGYGEDDAFGPYYIIKNSWGTDWGLSGYLLLARNANNMCGIATVASYPIVPDMNK